MIPTWWQFVLLALAAYRLTRLAGWDDFPLALKARAWATGARWEDPFLRDLVRAFMREIEDPEEPSAVIPAPIPAVTEEEEPRVVYDRPLVAHLLHCPFCLGFYVSAVVYWLWVWQPQWSLVGLMPFALSGAVGLIAKNLDG